MADIIQETFTEGAGFAPAADNARVVITDSRASRVFPESILAKIDGKAPESAAPVPDAAAPAETTTNAPAAATAPPTGEPAAVADPAKPAESAAPTPEAAKPPEPTPAAPTPDIERLTAANAALLAELEAARSKPGAPARSKLDDFAEAYIDDDIGSLRRFVAHSLGIDDPDHADVTAELQALTEGLTSKLFNVSLDATQQASRNAAKARQALARDKKARKAESDAAATAETAKAEQAKADQAAAFIGNRISTSDFPLLHALSMDLDGLPPAHLVWRAIDHANRTGEIDRSKMTDDQLIAYGAKKIETHYQALADKLGKARPVTPTSTAQQTPAPTPAASKSASQGTPQSHGGRTLTKADESAAPATPPSTAPTQPKRPKTRAEFLAERFPD